MKKITWKQLESFKGWIGIFADDNIDCVLGIGRGGFIPAVIVSHALNVPLYTLGVKRYIDINKPGKTFVDLASLSTLNLTGKKVMVVDDIHDKGVTAQLVKGILLGKGAKPSVFVYLCSKRPVTSVQGFEDYVFIDVPQEGWIHFPWEP